MSKTASILVIQGPNLNLLGTREPAIYGKTTLEDIHQTLSELAKAQSIDLNNFQSNHEGELIDRIQKAKQDGVDFIIINPGAFAHTSVALRDVLAGVAI
ncbi:MAG TPA: 3-dehydroquinate dehydratase, partial [Polynucleobacter sp.]|nr:3-dehydroquinate dehydratase [Polynucleobacter sp.]